MYTETDKGSRDGWEDWFVAKVTAKTGTSPIIYSWTEQLFDPDTGGYEDANSPRSGDSTDSPAHEVNNSDIDVDTYVFMRFKGLNAGVMEYEFAAPDGSLSDPTIGTVTTVDGSPSYSDIHTLKFDEDDGLRVTQPATGIARIDIEAATKTVRGIIDTSAQVMGDGRKDFSDGVYVNLDGGTDANADFIVYRSAAGGTAYKHINADISARTIQFGEVPGVDSGNQTVATTTTGNAEFYGNITGQSTTAIFGGTCETATRFICNGFNGVTGTVLGLEFKGGILTDSSGLSVVVNDGNYGDITVSSSGTVWSINNDAVALANIVDLTAGTILGSASAASPSELTVGRGMEITTGLITATEPIRRSWMGF